MAEAFARDTGAASRKALEPQALKMLEDGLVALGEAVGESAINRLHAYVELLRKWSRTYNLTAINDPLQIVRQHILDSATALPYVGGDRVLDVGTGAGLPGLVLAILRPHWQVTLLDSVAKKTRFCQHVAHALGATNVSVVNARVEQYGCEPAPQCIVSRAYASLEQFIGSTRHLAGAHTRLLAMKGRYPSAEISRARECGMQVEVNEVQVPGLDASRHMVVMHAAADAPGAPS